MNQSQYNAWIAWVESRDQATFDNLCSSDPLTVNTVLQFGQFLRTCPQRLPQNLIDRMLTGFEDLLLDLERAGWNALRCSHMGLLAFSLTRANPEGPPSPFAPPPLQVVQCRDYVSSLLCVYRELVRRDMSILGLVHHMGIELQEEVEKVDQWSCIHREELAQATLWCTDEGLTAVAANTSGWWLDGFREEEEPAEPAA